MPTLELVAWERDTGAAEQWAYGEAQTNDVESVELDAEIDRAKGILTLPDDWDGEGSSSYSATTFDRAVEFLKTHSKSLRAFGLEMPIPTIAPGPAGSIDVHWKRTSWELLVNIPAEGGRVASFYGDDYGVQQIRGTLNTEAGNSGLVAWLMK